MRMLGVDPASKTGWAIMEKPWKLIECGLINSEFKGGGRFHKFETAILEIIKVYKPTHCAYEIWHAHSGVVAAQILGGYSAVLQKICFERMIPMIPLEVGAIKRHGTGSHQASKKLMIATAKRLWPKADIVSDDVADALHIARLGLTKV